jgi:hypothetical protein
LEGSGNAGGSRVNLELTALIVAYTDLPGAVESSPRPILDVSLADMSSLLLPCLVDSGASNTLMPSWPVPIAGLDLAGVEPRALAVGGTSVNARFTVVRLSVAGLTWEAQVGFCDGWPYAWGLLGHDSFFRWFTVTFRAAEFEFEVEPNQA